MGYPRNHLLVARASKPSNIPSPPPLLRKSYPQKTWDEVTIKLNGILSSETTFNLWRNFEKEGSISFIELFEGKDGKRNGGGKIKFSPPPREAFWARNLNGYYPIQVEDGLAQYNIACYLDHNQSRLQIKSPTRNGVFYEPRMKLHGDALHFGMMMNESSMMSHYMTSRNVSFTVDLLKNRIVGTFDVEFKDPRHHGGQLISRSQVGQYDRVNQYMFHIPFPQLQAIQRMDHGQGVYSLIISLEYPPQFYRKRQDMRAAHVKENNIWSDFDAWYRQTDIVFDPYCLTTAKVTLHKDAPVIDIGRWTTYVFMFQNGKNTARTFDMVKQALGDFNISIISIDQLEKIAAHSAELWSLIDPPNTSHASADLASLAGGVSIYIPFDVRYQLEVCISREIINEYNITRPFVKKLAAIASENSSKARNILEYAAGQGKRIYDPMTLFENPEATSFSAKTEIPHYCAYSRKATVTPTTLYFSSPTVETTNRVLRHYSRENLDGRFLRVQFTDELAEGRINSSADKQRNDELFTRVYRTLYNGIQVGDRQYKFLAFGNSQFRENGAYFFCPTEHLSCDDIRKWMGNFSEIDVVAKYAARLGQCFSTTRAIHGLAAPDIIAIDDITRLDSENSNIKYCFTDGVGKISPFLAQMICSELGTKTTTAPSAFQFRLGGCKGILVTWPDATDQQVHIRRSQQKFTAIYNGLEIIRCSRFSHATLNRQTITILSALGVPDEVFLKMLDEQLSNYKSAMDNDDLAVNLLLRYIDDNQMTINIATMIRNGFMAERDPFVLSLLHLWRAWSIKLLKEKAKIIVENGAFLLGCVDETATLRGYSKPTTARGQQVPEDDLPQIFLQVPDKSDPSQYNVITGICLVGRNPSLHPGDLRVVQAIDVPQLHHLRDVVVFPSTGERDVPSMCSGGDLDGDDYFVIWEPALQPKEWNADPMNYSAAKSKRHNRSVEITDLMKFFVRFMKNDSLPTIAHAHLAQSDFLDQSVKDPKCLKLAELHSMAVDYVKTGEPAQMPKLLRPRKWPHFMEKKFKRQADQYHSQKILGQLYDRVDTVKFTPQWEKPFDKRILRAYKLDDSLLKTVRKIKTQYDTAMRRIMAQQEIETEFEVWSTFVLSKPRVGSDYKLQEEIARLADALKDQFRAVCIEKAGGSDFSLLGPFVAGMYKVTKEELDIALAECHTTKIVAGQEVPKRRKEQRYMPLITFPWLFEKELGRIATGIEASDELEELVLTNLNTAEPGRKRQGGRSGPVDVKDYVQREDGVIFHRGEELIIFDDDSDKISEKNGLETAHYGPNERFDFAMGGKEEIALATEFETYLVVDPMLSGTGVEDVVPRTELDGLVDRKLTGKPVRDHEGASGSSFDDWHHGKSLITMNVPPSPPQPASALASPTSADYSADDEGRFASSDNSSTEYSESEEQGQNVEIQFNTTDSALDRSEHLISEDHSGYSSSSTQNFEEEGVVRTKYEPSPENDWNVVDEEASEEEEGLQEEIITIAALDSPLDKLSRLLDS